MLIGSGSSLFENALLFSVDSIAQDLGAQVSQDFSHVLQLSLPSTILSDPQSFATLYNHIWAATFVRVPNWAWIWKYFP